MVQWDLRALHLVYRAPGLDMDAPAGLHGDIVEVECVGGFVLEVDPKTRQTTDRRKRFRFDTGGRLVPVAQDSWLP